MAQWIRHRPSEPGIAGSSPAGVMTCRQSNLRKSSSRQTNKQPHNQTSKAAWTHWGLSPGPSGGAVLCRGASGQSRNRILLSKGSYLIPVQAQCCIPNKSQAAPIPPKDARPGPSHPSKGLRGLCKTGLSGNFLTPSLHWNRTCTNSRSTLPAGLEPATLRLTASRSHQRSYGSPMVCRPQCRV